MNFPTIPVEDVQYNIAAEITKSDDEEQSGWTLSYKL